MPNRTARRAPLLLLSVASLFLFLLPLGNPAGASPRNAISPDGRILFSVDLDGDGRPFYRVDRDGRPVIESSRLGFVFRDAPPMNRGFAVEGERFRSGEEAWEQPWGERRFIRAAFNEMEWELTESDSPHRRMILTVRVFDDGLGFRFSWPQQPGLDRFAILDEETEFVFPGDPAAWWIPAYAGNRYEYLYERTRLSGLAADPLLRAVHTPLTLETEDGLLVALHEAELVDYAAMTLDPRPGSILACDLVPWSDGDRVKGETPFRTPWRTVQIAESPAALAESDLVLCLNEPSRIDDVSWIEPMKYVGIWWSLHIGKETWTVGPNHGATTENTKRYIDFAAANGFGGVLVEGWNTGWGESWTTPGAFDFTTPTPDYDLEELARYAKEKGVTLIGHLENGGDVAGFEKRMEAAYSQFERLGVRAVKTGYVSHGQSIRRYDESGREVGREWQHGQHMVRQYKKAVEEAAKHRIMVCAHEPIKDTGERRTWPNMMTREGARGQEYNAWSSGNPPEHTAILPFTRLLSAPMDFTPGVLNVKIEPYKPDNRVHTTVAKQLALYVIIYSPMQMAADLPEIYEGNPAFGFIRDVPADWEETRYLNGAVGDYVTVARKERGGEDWYLGSLTDEKPRVLLVPLDFLDPGAEYTAFVYADGPGADYRGYPEALSITREKVNAETVMRIDLAAGGGQAIRFRKNR